MVTIMSEQREYAYRFEYADKSACEIMPDGHLFLTWPDGKREEQRGKIDNRIPLLIGQAVKPRQDEIASLREDDREASATITRLMLRVESLEAQLASARKALQNLYRWCCGLNDFRPDSLVGRQAKSALTDEQGKS